MSKLRRRAVNLPDSVDAKLRARLRSGVANLDERVRQTCTETQQQQQTQTQQQTQSTEQTDTNTDSDDRHRHDEHRHRPARARRAPHHQHGDHEHRHDEHRDDDRGHRPPATPAAARRATMMAGEILAGRYELGDRLGVGGMSTVVSSPSTTASSARSAIKLLAEHLADDSQFVSRFRREALAAARLVHPNIVQVFDFGLDEASHRHYIVMELVRGHSGAEILRDEAHARDPRRARRSSPRPAAASTTRTATASCTATSSPATCCAARTASSSSPTSASPRRSARSRRSPRSARCSAPPPTWRPSRRAGEQAGPAADLYALGVVTYQFLSGRLPYEAHR